MLHKQVLAEAQDICSIKEWFCPWLCYKLFSFHHFQSLLGRDVFIKPANPEGLICETWLGCRLPNEVGVLQPPFLQQWSIIQILKPSAAVTHSGLKNLVSDSQQHISWRHATKHRACLEIGSRNSLRVIKWSWAVHNHSLCFQHRRQEVQLFVCSHNCFFGAP